jgi:hypothetical protein
VPPETPPACGTAAEMRRRMRKKSLKTCQLKDTPKANRSRQTRL